MLAGVAIGVGLLIAAPGGARGRKSHRAAAVRPVSSSLHRPASWGARSGSSLQNLLRWA